ncbi:MAG: DNA polymerase III subunit delta [Candidatus Solincola sediminis]|uniref:DNA polymerase III subunit delta n=1 Tax=Candidatus Solincola sediminis TaxID=1797199 RepID=A0A1F2WSN9_9ACTN|nr:MAG: DNA polymerase III subunit delta [Candidatus Solincola sediminis]OFW60903.1 MAG: DNA polymerase III subunit delta [Candidatus Solincola sediminis]
MPSGKRGVLLIHGNQRLLVEDELKKMQSKISAEDEDFNLDVFEAGEDKIEDVLQAADTLPLGSEGRFVIMKEAHKLSASDVKTLGKYTENPAERCLLILTAVGLKQSAPLLRLIEKSGRVKEVSKRRDQIPGWIRSRFTERGAKVTGKAIAYLHDALGDDLLAIESAVEKTVLYNEGIEEIDLDHVVPLVKPTAERSVFELVDRVAIGDSDQAVKLLRALTQQGEKASYLLFALSRHFRNLLLYKALREEGRQEPDIAARMKMSKQQQWTLAKKLKPQAARFNEEGLRKALSILVRVEMGIKSGEMDEDFGLELAISSLSRLPR